MRQSKAYFQQRTKLRIAAKSAAAEVVQLDKQLAKLQPKREKAAQAAEAATQAYTNFIKTKGAQPNDNP